MKNEAVNWVSLADIRNDASPDLDDQDLQFFCKVIEERSGIALKSTKRDLVRSRLRTRLTEVGAKSFSEYRRMLEKLPPNHQEWQCFVNELTTNKTDFFREVQHFEYLVQQIIPIWSKKSGRTFNIWSSAASSGEEAYTLAMVLSRHLPKSNDFKILATDIDTDILQVGKNAVYPAHRLIEIPKDYQISCVDRGRGDISGWFRIKRDIRSKVIFQNHNLIGSERPDIHAFDLILCRNVLIYFAQDKIEYVSNKLFSLTSDSGYLFIGHSDSFHSIRHSWKNIGPSVFQKKIL